MNDTTMEHDLDVLNFGDEIFKLLSKASSEKGGWIKSVRAYEIIRVGCLVNVTTRRGDQVAEALTLVPGVSIVDDFHKDDDREVIGRHLAPWS